MGSYRVRLARSKDMREIYLMGFDAWGNDQCEAEYLLHCEKSPKYASGKWLVLEDERGKLASSLITYPLNHMDTPAMGIGSLATSPSMRRQGKSKQLLSETLQYLQDTEAAREFYLWADISSEFYREFDFVDLPEKFQTRPGSVLMIRCSKERFDALLKDPDYRPPQYF